MPFATRHRLLMLHAMHRPQLDYSKLLKLSAAENGQVTEEYEDALDCWVYDMDQLQLALCPHGRRWSGRGSHWGLCSFCGQQHEHVVQSVPCELAWVPWYACCHDRNKQMVLRSALHVLYPRRQ